MSRVGDKKHNTVAHNGESRNHDSSVKPGWRNLPECKDEIFVPPIWTKLLYIDGVREFNVNGTVVRVRDGNCKNGYMTWSDLFFKVVDGREVRLDQNDEADRILIKGAFQLGAGSNTICGADHIGFGCATIQKNR